MRAIDVARKVVESKSLHLVRPRKNEPGEYDAKFCGEGNKRGWFMLDTFSASAIVAVHDNLNESNRAKFASLSLPKMAAVALKMVR